MAVTKNVETEDFANQLTLAVQDPKSISDPISKTKDGTVPPKAVRYACDRCEKTFGTGKSLKRHISIIHLGERKFPCLECGKAFGRSSHLNKHVLFVHKGLKSTHEDTSTNTKLLDIVHWIMKKHKDFWKITEDSLDKSMKVFDIDMSMKDVI